MPGDQRYIPASAVSHIGSGWITHSFQIKMNISSSCSMRSYCPYDSNYPSMTLCNDVAAGWSECLRMPNENTHSIMRHSFCWPISAGALKSRSSLSRGTLLEFCYLVFQASRATIPVARRTLKSGRRDGHGRYPPGFLTIGTTDIVALSNRQGICPERNSP